MDGLRSTDRVYLAGAVLAGIALLLLAFGAADGSAGRVESAEAATAAPTPAATTLTVTTPAAAPTLAPAAEQAPPAPAAAAKPAHPDATVLTVRPGASVALRDAPGGDVVETLGDTTEFGSPTVLTVLERHGAWAGVPSNLVPNGDLGWVKVDPDALAADTVGQRIVIDLSEMRGRLYRGSDLERRWTVGIGASGTPTPTGHFSITDEIEGGLNPVYGCCAIALSATQPNLPAGWSGGNRIAIHGTSVPLGEANSTGCVHSSDADLHALIDGVPLGTPVTIRH